MVSGQHSDGPRARGDPEADRYVASALERVDPSEQVLWLHEAVGQLRAEDEDPQWFARGRLRTGAKDLEWASEWLAGSDAAPSWFDEARITSGQQFFDDWCLPISICLFCASMPKAYAANPGVQVLARMSQLSQSGNVGTRVSNTGRMLLDITALHGLADDGPGRRRLRRVRLLHATSRALVAADPEPSPWPTEWGVPVCQEDQLGTLLSFSTTVLDAMRVLGISVSDLEEESYLYLWSVVGWFLGVEDPERIQAPSSARALQERLEADLFEHTEEGSRLLSLLLQDMRGTMPRFLAGVPVGLVYRLAGQRVADLMEVRPSRVWVSLVGGLAGLIRLLMALPGGRAALTYPSRRWGRTLIARPREVSPTSQVRPIPGPVSPATRRHGTR
jgi:hypothetical protein